MLQILVPIDSFRRVFLSFPMMHQYKFLVFNENFLERFWRSMSPPPQSSCPLALPLSCFPDFTSLMKIRKYQHDHPFFYPRDGKKEFTVSSEVLDHGALASCTRHFLIFFFAITEEPHRVKEGSEWNVFLSLQSFSMLMLDFPCSYHFPPSDRESLSGPYVFRAEATGVCLEESSPPPLRPFRLVLSRRSLDEGWACALVSPS